MSRRTVLFAALLLALAAPAGAAVTSGTPPAGTKPAGTKPAPAAAGFRNVTLHIFNRVFENFHDKVVVAPRQEFRIGDTDYTARVVRYVPDFSMDLKTRKVVSRGEEPRNPAFQVVVKRKGVPHDTSWVFFNMPPHFSARAEVAFVATRIEFAGRPPLESQDSLAIKIRAQEEAHR